MSQHTHSRIRAGLAATAVAALVLTGLETGTASASTPMRAGAVPSVSLARTATLAGSGFARTAKNTSARKRKWVLLYNRAQQAAPASSVYRATSSIRSKKRVARTKFRVTQMANGHVISARTASVKANRSWRKISVVIPASRQAGSVQVWTKRRKPVRFSGLSVTRVVRGSAVVVTPSPAPANPTGWALDMSEGFDSLSTSRWTVKNNTSASNENSYLLAANTSVGSGVLRIQGKLQSAGGRKYTSGYIQSNRKYSVPNYFRAEVRAKVPFEQGMWAAPLWFRPENGSDGEIDMVETYGKEQGKPLVHQTIHTEYGSTHKQLAFAEPFSSISKSVAASGWHTYTMEKVAGRITMWVDGIKTSEFTPRNPSWYNKYYEVAGRRWNLRVNMQIGGTWGGLPNASTDWSGDKSAMQVDYIRTWVPN